MANFAHEMGNKQKYYVVWRGEVPGIYESWKDCEAQTKGIKGAVYKSFDTLAEAQQAYASSPSEYIGNPASTGRKHHPEMPDYSSEVVLNALAVDAACSGNPGQMEYQGVYVGNRQQIFHFGPVFGTNNIGEFLAIVHGLAFIRQNNWDIDIYSDSKTAMSWVRQKKCKTMLPRDARTEALFQLIERAERWLHEHTYSTQILKWDTVHWGEIPADFGRKSG